MRKLPKEVFQKAMQNLDNALKQGSINQEWYNFCKTSLELDASTRSKISDLASDAQRYWTNHEGSRTPENRQQALTAISVALTSIADMMESTGLPTASLRQKIKQFKNAPTYDALREALSLVSTVKHDFQKIDEWAKEQIMRTVEEGKKLEEGRKEPWKSWDGDRNGDKQAKEAFDRLDNFFYPAEPIPDEIPLNLRGDPREVERMKKMLNDLKSAVASAPDETGKRLAQGALIEYIQELQRRSAK